jgi:hypothetical protein
MTRRLPALWREEKISGGYIVRDASGLAIAPVSNPRMQLGQLPYTSPPYAAGHNI